MANQKEYSNGELVVVWKPKLCAHAGICVHKLPKVYDPKARPWIKPENASTSELKEQIEKCPSGALSYYMKNEEKPSMEAANECKAIMIENGPLQIHGTISVVGKDGQIEVREKRTSFCRCGASTNKPYCDGSHRGISFEG